MTSFNFNCSSFLRSFRDRHANDERFAYWTRWLGQPANYIVSNTRSFPRYVDWPVLRSFEIEREQRNGCTHAFKEYVLRVYTISIRKRCAWIRLVRGMFFFLEKDGFWEWSTVSLDVINRQIVHDITRSSDPISGEKSITPIRLSFGSVVIRGKFIAYAVFMLNDFKPQSLKVFSLSLSSGC